MSCQSLSKLPHRKIKTDIKLSTACFGNMGDRDECSNIFILSHIEIADYIYYWP